MVKLFMGQYGGDVEVESSVQANNTWTRFTLRFPKKIDQITKKAS